MQFWNIMIMREIKMKKEIVSIVMSTTLLVNNVASPITVMADEVGNINNQTLEMTDENNVENNESSEGDIESLEIAEEENAISLELIANCAIVQFVAEQPLDV